MLTGFYKKPDFPGIAYSLELIRAGETTVRTVTDARIGANQLFTELIEAEARYLEAQELTAIWGGASSVPNP